MAEKKNSDVVEQKRLNEAREAGIPWKKWGPYLSERQWGTVREDYSQNGDAWNYFSHDQARKFPRFEVEPIYIYFDSLRGESDRVFLLPCKNKPLLSAERRGSLQSKNSLELVMEQVAQL